MIKFLNTYINSSGKPMIRRCENCTNWQRLKKLYNDSDIAPTLQRNIQDSNYLDIGYCRVSKILHAFSLDETNYTITKRHNVCTQHEYVNEELLKNTAEQITIQDALKIYEEKFKNV